MISLTQAGFELDEMASGKQPGRMRVPGRREPGDQRCEPGVCILPLQCRIQALHIGVLFGHLDRRRD